MYTDLRESTDEVYLSMLCYHTLSRRKVTNIAVYVKNSSFTEPGKHVIVSRQEPRDKAAISPPA